jgi:hypothetical protein
VVFRAIAGCIVPSDAASPGADADGAIALADRAISERPAADRKLLSVFLKAVEHLPRLRYGRPFSKLTGEQRASVLSFLESNTVVPKLRAGFFGVKTFALLGYYGSESTFANLNYPGPRLDAPFYQLRGTRDGGER